jgi:hypothetical protein
MLPIIALCLAAVGCGSSGSSSISGETDQQQVIELLTGYYAAVTAGDFQRACGYLTLGRKGELIKEVNELPPTNNPPVTSCVAALNSIFRTPDAHQLINNPQLSGVTVAGGSARALATTTASDGNPITTHYSLTSTDAGWKIARGSGSTNATPQVSPP